MKTKNILITGATGNIGHEVIRYLFKTDTKNKIIAGVRDIIKAKIEFSDYSQLDFVQFDFENFETFDKALENIDCVFLLRPPRISDTDKYFKPLIAKVKAKNITQIMFLSVQGVEKSSIIPHNKIEKLIKENHIGHIFLRPGYFMQNLTTTLIGDIRTKRKIILPAGKAGFNWVDVENIGEVAALLLNDFESYKNQDIEITGYENKNFYEVTALINECTNSKIEYVRPDPFKYYRIKKRDGLARGMILVMIMLHFLPRFQRVPGYSDFYEKLTGKKPTTLKDFIKRENKKFNSIVPDEPLTK